MQASRQAGSNDWVLFEVTKWLSRCCVCVCPSVSKLKRRPAWMLICIICPLLIVQPAFKGNKVHLLQSLWKYACVFGCVCKWLLGSPHSWWCDLKYFKGEVVVISFVICCCSRVSHSLARLRCACCSLSAFCVFVCSSNSSFFYFFLHFF